MTRKLSVHELQGLGMDWPKYALMNRELGVAIAYLEEVIEAVEGLDA